MRRASRTLAVATLTALWIAAGCASLTQLLRARSHVAQLPDSRFLRGTIELDGAVGDEDLVIVAVHEETLAPVSFQVAPSGSSWWLVTGPGRYRVAAFSDRNRDRVRQPGEPAILLDEPRVVDVRERVLQDDLDLLVSTDSNAELGFPLDLSEPDLDVPVRLGPTDLGTVMPLEAQRFSPESGRRGLWEPLSFMQDTGGGIFFLEPYDPDRTPVLFVHGSGGNPQEFTALIAALDRDRFQPWLGQYPSALRLEQVADGMAAGLEALHEAYGFERLVLVAHSMGGLVSRAYLNDRARRPSGYRVELFVTFATPWAGHAAAEAGVERSPVVIPSWRDIRPGSHFVQDLFETPLPEHTEHHLFFAFEGHRRGGATAGANDGVVAVASQLSPEAQAGSARVRGLPESHTGIIRSPAAAKALNALLAAHD